MSYIVVIGEAGVGKTSWIVSRLKHIIRTEGQRRLKQSIATIEYYNRTRENLLTPPYKIPIYTNFDSQFKIGYEKIYKPYFINEKYFGLPNKGKLVIPVVPYSVVAFQEMDEEYNSRDRGKMAESISGLYFKRRHWHLDIFADLHKLTMMDSIVRTAADKVIEIQKSEHELNFAGRIVKTTWYCREFDDIKKAQLYVSSDGKEGEYKETTYTDEGDVFRCFNSRSCAEEFLPQDGEDFIYLPHSSEIDITTLPPEKLRFYTKGDK